MFDNVLNKILPTLYWGLKSFGGWLFDWQTLVGAGLASMSAIGAAFIAWKAVMKQIEIIQSERAQRTDYATTLAASYLAGLRDVVTAVKKQEKNLDAVTEERWKADPTLAPSILSAAHAAFTEPNPRSRMGDVESYRLELPISLSNNLRFVFRLENDLDSTIAELLGQQNVACAFPILDCQRRLHTAIKKLEEAINSAELSIERFRYE